MILLTIFSALAIGAIICHTSCYMAVIRQEEYEELRRMLDENEKERESDN